MTDLHIGRLKQMLTAGLMSGLLVLEILTPCAFAGRLDPEMDTLLPYSGKPAEGREMTLLEELTPHLKTTPKTPEATAPVVATPGSVLKGRVDVEKEFVPDIVFGESQTLEKGERLTLVMMDMVATGYSQGGDEFMARVKFPVERNGKVLIPAGVLVKGHVVSAAEPGEALSKRGKIVVGFDYILMPDGRKIPFKSEFAKGDSGLKAFGRAVGHGLGGTIGGALQGVLVGLRFGGVAAAAATDGVSLMVAGGIGAVAGLGQGLSRAGSNVLLNEGDEIQVALQEALSLPEIILPPDTQNEIHAQGLTVQVADYILERDPFRIENQIRLKVKIDNQTDYKFGSFDIALVDEYQHAFFLSPFGETGMLILQIAPKSQLVGDLTFNVKSPQLRHYLVFYKPYTREVVAKVSLTEALKNLRIKPASTVSSRKTKKRTQDDEQLN